MNLPLPSTLAADWRATIKSLREQFPDADDQTLFDTCDGLTDAADAVAAMVRQALELEAMDEANRQLADMYSRRRLLLSLRAHGLRNAALRLLEDMGEKTLRRPEFTLSVSHRKGRVEVYDEESLPEEFFDCRTVRSVNRERLTAAAERGELPSGVRLTNGSTSLTVRSR